VDGLPQYGFGAKGGWIALAIYVVLLGTAMWWRWRTGSWRRMRV
jgi:MATE family multidrug resistance protein